MAETTKAYQRFGDLTKQAMAPTTQEGAGPVSAPEEPLSILLSPKVRRALEEQAAADHTTPSEIVEEALRRYLKAPRWR